MHYHPDKNCTLVVGMSSADLAVKNCTLNET